MAPTYEQQLTNLHNRQLLMIEILLRAIHPDKDKPRACLERAMELANEALDVGAEHRRPDLVARSQLYRGHIFRSLRLWKEAHLCYVKAASACGHEVERLTGEMIVEIEHDKFQHRKEREGREALRRHFESLRAPSARGGRDARRELEGKAGPIDAPTVTAAAAPLSPTYPGEVRISEFEMVMGGHCVKDEYGRIIKVLGTRPPLRSMKGRSFCDDRQSRA